MNYYIYKLIMNGGTLKGIEKQLATEFKTLYKISGEAWKYMGVERLNNIMEKEANAIFIAKEKQTEKVLGFCCGLIFPNTYCDDQVITSWLQSKKYTSLSEKYYAYEDIIASHKDPKGFPQGTPYCSVFRLFVVDSKFRGQGIGQKLMESFKRSCGNEFIEWGCDSNSNLGFYLHSPENIMVAAAEKGQKIFLTSNDTKKNALLQVYSCYMSFPEKEHAQYQVRLEKEGFAYTTRASQELYKYNIGQQYCASFGYIIKIESKQFFNSVKDHPFYDTLSAEEIAELKKHEKNGIMLYKFSSIAKIK